jgi:hypothetical protein
LNPTTPSRFPDPPRSNPPRPPQGARAFVPFSFEDYLDLVETTGCSLHPGKRGLIAERVPRKIKGVRVN